MRRLDLIAHSSWRDSTGGGHDLVLVMILVALIALFIALIVGVVIIQRRPRADRRRRRRRAHLPAVDEATHRRSG